MQFKGARIFLPASIACYLKERGFSYPRILHAIFAGKKTRAPFYPALQIPPGRCPGLLRATPLGLKTKYLRMFVRMGLRPVLNRDALSGRKPRHKQIQNP